MRYESTSAATRTRRKGVIAYCSDLGVKHFTRLGVSVKAVPVIDRASAQDESLAWQQGFGLLDGAIILPHYNEFSPRTASVVRARLGTPYTLQSSGIVSKRPASPTARPSYGHDPSTANLCHAR